MALTTANLRRVSEGCADGEKRHGRFMYKTDDTKAQVETNGYFDAAAEHFTEGVGDVLEVITDADGTPVLHTYLVTRTAGGIALTLSVATAAA
ncbi:MAG: hypothetical protein WA989_09350 [Henriciella sp.]|uniref:hypothetical protein n=1 Tax=Henriciella sp. TaxID=1968823 RepID=UPI003C727CBD